MRWCIRVKSKAAQLNIERDVGQEAFEMFMDRIV
jgi:hypothetical protein